MRTKVQKWGNSLGVRIPKPLAQEARLANRSWVEISVSAGKLVVSAVEPALTLRKLLAGVTDENLHGEITTGRLVGKESW